jgi:hypothetical protein
LKPIGADVNAVCGEANAPEGWKLLQKCWHTVANKALCSSDFQKGIDETNQLETIILQNNTGSKIVLRLFK